MTPTPGLDMAGLPVASLSVTPEQGNRVGGSGVPSQGLQQSPDTPPAEPFLFGDIEPVHFARLYPDMLRDAVSGAAEAAMAAGWDAYNASMSVMSAQEAEALERDMTPEEREQREREREQPQGREGQPRGRRGQQPQQRTTGQAQQRATGEHKPGEHKPDEPQSDPGAHREA
jgi:hypothetical protein